MVRVSALCRLPKNIGDLMPESFELPSKENGGNRTWEKSRSTRMDLLIPLVLVYTV